MSFTITLLITICTKISQKNMYFQKPGRNSKNLEEIQKTWKKNPKPMATLYNTTLKSHILVKVLGIKISKETLS